MKKRTRLEIYGISNDTKEGLKEMPSALERETAQRGAAKQRTSGLTSLLEARIKP